MVAVGCFGVRKNPAQVRVRRHLLDVQRSNSWGRFGAPAGASRRARSRFQRQVPGHAKTGKVTARASTLFMATTRLQNGTKFSAPGPTVFSGLALQRKCACGGSA